MSVILSSHNLGQFNELNFDLSTHYRALRILDSVPDEERDSEWSRLLCERISFMSDSVLGFKILENCIRKGTELNYDPDENDFNYDPEENDCDSGCLITEQSEDSPKGCV